VPAPQFAAAQAANAATKAGPDSKLFHDQLRPDNQPFITAAYNVLPVLNTLGLQASGNIESLSMLDGGGTQISFCLDKSGQIIPSTRERVATNDPRKAAFVLTLRIYQVSETLKTEVVTGWNTSSQVIALAPNGGGTYVGFGSTYPTGEWEQRMGIDPRTGKRPDGQPLWSVMNDDAVQRQTKDAMVHDIGQSVRKSLGNLGIGGGKITGAAANQRQAANTGKPASPTLQNPYVKAVQASDARTPVAPVD